jgi:isochorismate synthase
VTETLKLNDKFTASVESKRPILVFRLPGREVATSIDTNAGELFLRGWDQESIRMDSHFTQKEITLPHDTTRTEYSHAFSKFKNELEKGLLKKAILSRVIRQKRPSNFDPVAYFISLSENYPDAFVYLLYHPEVGMWTGASPEVMLKGASGKYHTVALAGTQAANLSGIYEWGSKEIEEQELVSQHIRGILSEIQASSINEDGPYTSQAGNVVHLKTDFDFEFQGDLNALINVLHPTPAIAGLPVKEAIHLIATTEKHDRRLYTGLIGLKNDEETHIYVNLRCMQIGDEELAVYVGGGLTAKSDEEAEWEETRMKAKTLLNLLKS